MHAKLRREFTNERIPEHIFYEDPPEFFRIGDALDATVTEYRVDDPRIHHHDIVSIFEYLRPHILRLIEAHPNTKVYLNIHMTMFQPSSGETEMKGLRTGAQEFLRGTNPEDILRRQRNILYERLAKLEDAVGSGWTLVRIEYLTMKFAEYLVTIGSSYKPLPEEIATRKGAIDNVDNSKDDDQQCFKWATTRAMFSVARRGNVLTKKLREQAENFNWDGINFPTSLLEIDIFENLNKTSVMVLGWNEKERRTEYLRLPKTKHGKAIQLFYHDDHYSTIKKMPALVRRDFGDNANHFCNFCPFHH